MSARDPLEGFQSEISRLSLLAEAYAQPSRAFLSQFVPAPVRRAIDLGCGPGYSTLLVREAAAATSCVGIDSSARCIEAARALAPKEIEFLCHDLLVLPPLAAAELVFARFALTQLTEPEKALTRWSELLVLRGMLLVQEISLIDTEHPTLNRYHQLTQTLQAHHGRGFELGRNLAGLVKKGPFLVEHYGQRMVELPAHVVATLEALGLSGWKNDSVARQAFDPKEVAEVEQGLLRIAQRAELCAPVRVGIGELVLRGDG